MLEFLITNLTRIPEHIFSLIGIIATVGGFLRFVFGIQNLVELFRKLQMLWHKNVAELIPAIKLLGFLVVPIAIAVIIIPRIELAIRNYNTVQIGAILPLSGDFASWGGDIKKGIDLGVDKVNSSGGINGKKLRIIVKDYSGTNQHAVSAVSSLLKTHVPVVIGGLHSPATLAVSPFFQDSETVLLNLLSAAPQASNLGNYIFRICPSDNYEPIALAEFVVEKYHRVAVLSSSDSSSVDFADTFIRKLESSRVTIPIDLRGENWEDNIDVFLRKLNKAAPDAILLAFYNIENTIKVLQQIKKTNLRAKILTTAIMDNAGFITSDKQMAFDGIIFATLQSHSLMPKTSDERLFFDTYNSRYSSSPTWAATYAYDATLLLSQILERGAITGSQIRNTLYSIDDFKGISGPINFDSKGDNRGYSIQIKTIKNGAVSLITTTRI